MENASDALTIAGSLLLALIIITALVFTFQKINNSEDISSQVTAEEQTNDFNKEFTSFEKDLYGSELLSLINKAIDYNARFADTEGYKTITISFHVVNGTGGTGRRQNFVKSNTTYHIKSKDDRNSFAINLLEGISTIRNKYHGDAYLQRLVTLYDTYLYNTGEDKANALYDIKMILEDIGKTEFYIPATNSFKSEFVEDIQKYTEYVEFKRKKFEWNKTSFDGDNGTPGNGRVTGMTYTEITGP